MSIDHLPIPTCSTNGSQGDRRNNLATSHETDLEETAGLVNLLDCNCLVMFYDYEWLAMTIHMDQYIHDMWMFHDVEQKTRYYTNKLRDVTLENHVLELFFRHPWPKRVCLKIGTLILHRLPIRSLTIIPYQRVIYNF